ncbi:MAG: dihydroorotate dehydrogenase-like protein [Bacteroidota bacterium]|nr:dihydroorotate dehydrogenase-like protein [Bacteroidota bacterium]
MANLQTSYVGLTLRNPLIVSSSGLADSIEKIKNIDKAGAGAVVLKSLFEEQINAEAGKLMEDNSYPEAADYIQNYTKSNKVDEYFKLIEEAKKETSIPIFASVNCVSGTDWIDFSKKVEAAGADGLEINLFILPVDASKSSVYESQYFDLVRKIRESIRIPIILKISSFFTNIIYMVNQFYQLGVNAVVLFNRMYEPDINIEDLSLSSAEVFSSPADLRNTLRWVSLVSDSQKDIQISASTGVHDSSAAIKVLLAGAQTVQLCSTLYKNGVDYLGTVISEMEAWMDEKGFDSIEDYRGKLNYRSHKNPRMWERSQFMRYFSNKD